MQIRYYAGRFGNADSDSRISYYHFTGTPSLMFNGTESIVGAGDDDQANAESYMAIVRDHSLDPAPVRISVDDFDASTGATRVSVRMYSESLSLDGENILFVLIEDDLAGENTHVTRQVLSDSISLSGAGASTSFDETFDIDPSWDPASLHVVAFIQQADWKILQVGTDYETPSTMIRAIAPFARVIFGSSTSSHEFDPVSLVNVGQSDSFTIRAVIDEAPSPDWGVEIRDGDGELHSDQFSIDLDAEANTEIRAVVNPGSEGSFKFHLEVSSPNLDKKLEIPMGFVTDNIDVLLIDDDGGYDYEQYFVEALTAVGKSYGVWDRSAAELPDEALSADVLVWNVGLGYPSLDPADRDFLTRYFDGGGALFLSGQDVGWDLNSSQSSNKDVAFFHDYLHAFWRADNSGVKSVHGVAGDPISDSMELEIAGGDGADNQDFPDVLVPISGEATEILSYGGAGQTAGLRYEDGSTGSRLVYLAFGFEGIDNAADRRTLMQRALRWLHPWASIDDDDDTGFISGPDIKSF